VIPLEEINAVADKFQVPAETIEKDYVISWILLCLSKSKLQNDFIFYGGTAIKRIYFEEHRFSEDIDLLSSSNFTHNYLLQELNTLRHAGEEANLFLEVNKNNIIATRDRIQLFVHYSGYDEIIGAPKEVRLDFSMGMDLFGEVADKEIIKSYSDLKIQNETLSVMTLNTILANKLGLLLDLTRNEPRDLFDIWFLLQRTNDFDFAQVSKAFVDKYGYRPSLNILLPALNSGFLKTNWDIRLNKQMAELPNIENVTKDIKIKLEKLFIKQS